MAAAAAVEPVAAEDAAAASRSSSAADWARTGRTAWQALPSGPATVEPWTASVIRLIFAVAVGVIALELGSMATGRYFDWNLKTGWNRLRSAGTYVGLYPGQPAPGQLAAASRPAAAVLPAARPSALPGVGGFV